MAIVRVENLDGTFSEIDDSTFATPKPVEEAGAIRSLGDTLLKFGRGGANAVKAATDAFGANNAVSRGASNVAEFLDSGISDEGKQNDRISAQRLQLSQDQGVGAQLKAVGKNFLDNPIDTLAEGAGSILPTAAAMLLSKGKVNPATVGAGLGIAQGAGAVKGSIYDATKQNALTNGMTEQEADALATEAQAYSGDNADQIGVGAGLGYLAGKTGAETSSLLTGQVKDNVGLLRNTLKGAATEGLTEGAQGGQEALAANLALQRQGEDVPLMRGVVGQAGSEAVAGGLTGGAFGAADALTSQPQQEQDPRAKLRDTLLAQNPTGALTQAAATAIDTGASDEVLGLPFYAGEPLVVAPDGSTMTRAEAEQRRYAPQPADKPQEEQKPVSGLLPNKDLDPLLIFKDGSTGRKSDFDNYMASLPTEDAKAKLRAQLLGYAPQKGGENVSDTRQNATNMVEQPNGQSDNIGTGSATNTLSQSGNGSASGNTAEAPTQGGNGDLPVRTADTSANGAVKPLNELAIGETAKVGDATFKKTENGFERVEDEQNGNVLPNEPKTPNDNINDGQQGIQPRSGYSNAETSGVTSATPAQQQESRAVDVSQQPDVPPQSQAPSTGDGNIRAESDIGAQQAATNNSLEKPQEIITKTPLDAQANEAATSPLNERAEPTQAQKDAGNYKVGRAKVSGLDISIENPQGSQRKGVDPDGKEWESTMTGHYGYIRGVKAKAPDKDRVDVYVKPSTPEDFSGNVYVVNQKDPKTGKFDEPKVMMGYESAEEAKAAYDSNYTKDWQGFDSMAEVPMDKFKSMLDDEQAFQKPVKATKTAAELFGSKKQEELNATPTTMANDVSQPRTINQEGSRADLPSEPAQQLGNSEQLPTEVVGNDDNVAQDKGAKVDREYVAKRYAEELAKDREGVSSEPKEYHYKFADAIEKKDAYALEHLANGLNDKGKKVFSEITGVKLPKTQQATWETLRDWAGIDPKKDTLDRAFGNVEREKKRLDGKVSEDGYKYLDERVKSGFREIRTINGQRFLTNGVDGVNLSKRGTGMNRVADYLKARIAYENANDDFENSKSTTNTPAIDNKTEVIDNNTPENDVFTSDITEYGNDATESVNADSELPASTPTGELTSAPTGESIATTIYDKEASRQKYSQEVEGFADFDATTQDKVMDIERLSAMDESRGNVGVKEITSKLRYAMQDTPDKANELLDKTVESFKKQAKDNLEYKALGKYEEKIGKAVKTPAFVKAAVLNGALDVSGEKWANDYYEVANIDPAKIKKQEKVAELSDDANETLRNFNASNFKFNAVKALDKQIRVNGNVAPVRDNVRALVEKGGVPNIYTEEGKKPVYSIKTPDGVMHELGKTAHDFAQHLIGKNPTISKTETVENNYPARNTPLVDLSGKQKKVWFNRFDVESNKIILDVVFNDNGKNVQDEMRTTPEVYSDRFSVAESENDAKKKADLLSKTLAIGGRTNTESRDILGDNTKAKQDIADTEAAKDAKRNNGDDNQDGFVLTGSNSEADKSAAMGAQDLFAQPSAQQAIEAIKADDTIPTADKIKLAADLRNGNVTADDVSAIVTAQSEQETSEEPQAQASISDFGEKLEGAKKDLWRNYKKAMSDELPSDASEITLSKYFPEPDYENLIASGVSVDSIAVIKAMRDSLPSKPKMPSKVRRWVAELKSFRELSSRLIEGTSSIEDVTKDLLSVNTSSSLVDRLMLYTDLGYPAIKSAKGYSVTGGWTNYDRGVPLAGSQTAIELPNGRREYFKDRATALEALRAKLAIEPEKTEKKVKLDVYRVTKTGELVIGKKVASNKYIDLKGGFATSREAFQYYADNEAELLELLEKRKNFRPERKSVNNPRVGEDYRKGEDVTPEKFAAEFGFRGVQFGNYVEQSRRPRDLNNAYDALLDLSHAIGIPPRAISLNGTLGLAFGARGSGGKNPAAAHYESSEVVINLTKVNGFGSLGHEWFHAMDNYLSKARGKNDSYITGNPRVLKVREGNKIVDDVSVRPELLEAFNDVMKVIKGSDYFKRSIKRDNTRTNDYWSTDHELAARAFEAYLIAKFKKDGKSNDYLANVEDEEVAKIMDEAAKEFLGTEEPYPYPTRAEQETINPMFDKLFATLQTKETDNGNVAMFSRSAMKSVEANKARGEQSMNEALLSKADVNRAMYHNELGWIDFVWGDDKRGIQHIVKGRIEKDGMAINDVYKLLTKDLIDTIASGEVIRKQEIPISTRIVVAKGDYEAVLVKNNGNNGWLLNGWELKEPDAIKAGNDTKKATQLKANSTDNKLVAGYMKELSNIAGSNVNNSFRTSISLSPTSTLLVDDVKAALAKDTYGHEVDIYPTMMDAPYYIQQQVMKERVSPEGFFDPSTNRVALILENLDSVKRAVEVARHELVGHYGLENMLNEVDPEILPKLLNSITMVRRTGLNPVINELSEEVLASQPALVVKPTDTAEQAKKKNDRIAKEIIAFMAEKNIHNGFMRTVIDAVRKFLKKIGFIKSDVSDAYISSLLRDAQVYLKRTGRSVIGGNPAMASFSNKFKDRVKDGVNEMASFSAGKQEIPDTITVKAEKLAFDAANKELERENEFEIQDVLNDIANGNGGVDIADLADNPLYWDAENETLTDEGYAEYDRLNIEYAKEKTRFKKVDSISDLDDLSQEVQTEALEGLFDGYGIKYNRDRSYSTSRYFNVEDKDGGAFKVRLANHANTAKGMGAPDYNIAPDVLSFSEAWDLISDRLGINPTSTSDFKDGSPTRGMQERQAVRAVSAEAESGSLEELAQQGVGVDGRNVLPDTILVNGKSRQTRNSNGQLIHPTIEGIEKFYEWFGDSKVVDAQGRPLVVYHGTTKGGFTEFSTNGKRVKVDGAYFFTSNRRMARSYSGVNEEIDFGKIRDEYDFDDDIEEQRGIYSAYLKLENPNYTDMMGANWDGQLDSPQYNLINEDGDVFDTVNSYEDAQEKIDNGDAVDYEEVDNLYETTDGAVREGMRLGLDGAIIYDVQDNGGEYDAYETGDVYVAFNPNQIKSIGNNGNFDGNNDSILFSAKSIAENIEKLASQNKITERAFDYFAKSSAQEFGAMGGVLKNIRTQYDKAQQDPTGTGRMFNQAQRFELDANLTAARPAEEAPTLLGKDSETFKESVKRIKEGDKYTKDREVVADWLFEGTLAGETVLDGKVFTDAELKGRGATDTQIKLYREARNAVNQSLQESVTSLVYNMVRNELDVSKDAMIKDPSNSSNVVRDAWNNRMNKLLSDYEKAKKAKDISPEFLAQQRAEMDRLSSIFDDVTKVYSHAKQLKEAGYMPLSRFGRYSLTAYNKDGEVSAFYRFDSEMEAKAKEKEIKNKHDRLVRGVMPENQSNIFAGADPETVSLFIEHLENTGFDVNDAVFQEWYRSAVSDRSALKRLIHRKGTEGFDTDIERVLSSFITSNSRFAASNYNRGDMLETLDFLKTDPKYKHKGDVFDEAKNLFDYVNNPADPFTVGRSFMFTWFMGGSLASAAVNMTQPFTMTFPQLAGHYSAKDSASAIKNAIKLAGSIVFGNYEPKGELGEALTLAREIGLVDPQQTHHLYRMGSKSMIDKLPFLKNQKARLQGVSALWGMMFARTESLNRYISFIAAFNLAKAEGKKDPFSFAKKIVDETQGIYSKANRPNWARGTGSLGTVGAMAFTFKQFSIAWVEMLARNYQRGGIKDPALLWQLGILMMLGGAMGLPFADDGEDLLDTASQLMGGEGNSRRAIRDAVFDTLGEDMGALALYGVSAFMPFDIQGRMSMSNLIPATNIMLPSNQDRSRSAMELFGAGGSMVSDGMDAVQNLGAGKSVLSVAEQFAPVAIKNILKGVEMSDTGFYDDTKGRRVVDTGYLDALFKSIGFQPSIVAETQRQTRIPQMSIDRTKQVESQIAEQMARARFDGDQEKMQDAIEKLQKWNEDHPDLPIVINPRQVFMRVRAMHMTREERQAKATPRELRATLLQ